jgi:hypothetical protein
MNDLEFLQLLIVVTIIFWIFINYKKKSRFAAGPSLEIPWNLYSEKNKVYLLMKDPLDYDLGFTYTTVNTSPLIRYQQTKGFSTTQFATGITLDEEDRLETLTSVDNFVNFQNTIVTDLNALATTIMLINSVKINFDFSAITKLNIKDIPKYVILQSGKPYANLLQGENFEPVVTSTDVLDPKEIWDTSDTVIGQMNTSISGDILFYQNVGNTQYNIPDESSVTFNSGIGLLGRSDFKQFPPSMFDNSTSKAAVFKYINLKNNSSIKSPYLRQNIYLKKDYTYTLSFFYFGFIPLFINLINTMSNWTKTIIGTQNDIGYDTWLYRKIDFKVDRDGVYLIEFTPMLTGNETLYPGTDPEKNSRKYHAQCMLQKVIVEVNVPKSKIPGYSELVVSPLKDDKVVFILLNGKLLRLGMNSYDSLDPTIINKRRDDISKFITKNYVV